MYTFTDRHTEIFPWFYHHTTALYILRIEIIWRTDSINWQIGKCQALCFDSGFHQFIIKLNYFWMISYYYWYWHCRWLTAWLTPISMVHIFLQSILRAIHMYMCTVLCWCTEFSQEFIWFSSSSPHSLCSWFRTKCVWFFVCSMCGWFDICVRAVVAWCLPL